MKGHTQSQCRAFKEPRGHHHQVQQRRGDVQVGMQNSTLGASLALMHFADPLTAAPCAVSACMHSVIGSLLAAYWQRADPDARSKGGVDTIEEGMGGAGA